MPSPIPINIRPEIAALPSYRQGKPAPEGAYKLSSNENPYPPLSHVVQILSAQKDINRYPDANEFTLRQDLANRFGVTADEVMLGAGSVSLITQLLLAVARDAEVVYSWRSFEAYPIITLIAGGTAIEVPNDADGRHNMEAIQAAITDRTRAVILCSPNNPTGTVITAAEFEAFMESVPHDLLVILDEAYVEFVRDAEAVNGADYVRRFPNLVILRTFSKAYGLAGLRIGYGIAHPEIVRIAGLTMVPLSITKLSVKAAEASLQPDAETELMERVENLVQLRHRFFQQLRKLEQEHSADFGVPYSESNFIWIPSSAYDSAALEQQLFRAGVVVRAFPDGVRVSIGETEAVDKVLKTLTEVVGRLSVDR